MISGISAMDSTNVLRMAASPGVRGVETRPVDDGENRAQVIQAEPRVETGPTDATGLRRSPEELAGSLQAQEQEQSAKAQETAYLAAGRAARYGQEAEAMPGLFASMQAGTPAGAQAAAQPDSPIPARIEAGDAAADSARIESGRSGTSDGNTNRQSNGNNTGGMEVRSAERTFVGSTSEGAEHPSGRHGEDAEDAEQQGAEEASGENGSVELTEQEEAEVEELKSRDREVRTHEQAHMSAAGGLASGGASFQKTRGPDGNMYAVGGEVQIDTSEASSPEATIAKAQRVKAAALAPAEPSAQDRQVAAQASQMETTARQEKITQKEEEKDEGGRKASAAGETDPEQSAGASGLSAFRREPDPNLIRRAERAYAQAPGSRFPQYKGGVLSFAV